MRLKDYANAATFTDLEFLGEVDPASTIRTVILDTPAAHADPPAKSGSDRYQQRAGTAPGATIAARALIS